MKNFAHSTDDSFCSLHVISSPNINTRFRYNILQILDLFIMYMIDFLAILK